MPWAPRRAGQPDPTAAIACCRPPLGSAPGHVCGARHPEAPERLRACFGNLTGRGLWRELKQLPQRAATDDELSLCHDPGHLRGLQAAAEAARRGGRALYLPPGGCLRGVEPCDLPRVPAPGLDTYIAAGSMDAARASAGGLLALVDEALGHGPRRGLGLCRPPGHHAGRASCAGFCLLNNVAVAAAYACAAHPDKVRRVLIFDWDVHHGQGTQEIFWADPRVLVFSAHRHGVAFYPGTGDAGEVGEGPGLGFTVNAPLPAGYGDGCLWAVCADSCCQPPGASGRT
ncbi:unnamed protein product [Prorocentrum cordatum]|uniref:Histone deacetylase domain-containing protein n=1 Tax=Prorocentrum cordatum TaxID=2364126 RepID=A0ABN9PUC9_9DINO|nr:unnamed protein product [Polarella glacialis]CAK0898693.1 unnamed protein product [Polarella glacialis]